MLEVGGGVEYVDRVGTPYATVYATVYNIVYKSY
jgi:hypothetical protein